MIHPETRIACPAGLLEALNPSRRVSGIHFPSISYGLDSVEWSAPDRSVDPSPMVRLTTYDGFSLVCTADQKILTLEGRRLVWSPVQESLHSMALLAVGFGDIGKASSNQAIAVRAGMIDIQNPILPVWEGDRSMREAWIRGAVEGFASLKDGILFLPYSSNLQILLLSVGIPSTKESESLLIHPYWLQTFCQIIQPSFLKKALTKIINSMTQPDDMTPFGSRIALSADTNSMYQNFSRYMYLSQIIEVRESNPTYGYSWKSSLEIGMIANGLIIGG